ncbi:hypothetical protein UFOVP1492_48 [uncultured Caudovirales phage]|uniref:Lysozyme n=1 Tax=uncultured Caudovirales phage TaxID=2100421 RepID=A0A6J5QSI8_9CAUD|nr:hypothetical protein UFOVP1127_86 [uncultured Caudovirales phage]CAB4193663.1 hypothetical protein UFOVP1242_124 [uncultured Caudovirales phage]CAB4217596.1 hypothetical protein UFOVP1492_48 [uncultured Caudovirales phage]CAB5231417.1 hypothetical protein UFOVP1580_77 [uncultured Caudovirales phage]
MYLPRLICTVWLLFFSALQAVSPLSGSYEPTPLPSEKTTLTVEEGMALILKHAKTRESYASLPYWDQDSWAIGYGVKISAKDAEYYRSVGGISEKTAVELSLRYYRKAAPTLSYLFVNMTEKERLAVTSLFYAAGSGRVKEKAPQLWAIIKSRDKSEEARQIWMKSFCKNKRNAPGRAIEANLWCSETLPTADSTLLLMSTQRAYY